MRRGISGHAQGQSLGLRGSSRSERPGEGFGGLPSAPYAPEAAHRDHNHRDKRGGQHNAIPARMVPEYPGP